MHSFQLINHKLCSTYYRIKLLVGQVCVWGVCMGVWVCELINLFCTHSWMSIL